MVSTWAGASGLVPGQVKVDCADARQTLSAVREHRGIENSLYGVLDMAFAEDGSRVRKDRAPQDLATLRHLALNLLREEKTDKNGVRAQRLRAGWDNGYLLKALTSRTKS